VILDVRIGVEGDCGDVVDALHGLPVQGFDVAKSVGKTQAGHTNLVGGQAVKHKGIVGVGTVSYRDFAFAFSDGSRRVVGSSGDESHD
jgi:hypothetical protein